MHAAKYPALRLSIDLGMNDGGSKVLQNCNQDSALFFNPFIIEGVYQRWKLKQCEL